MDRPGVPPVTQSRLAASTSRSLRIPKVAMAKYTPRSRNTGMASTPAKTPAASMASASPASGGPPRTTVSPYT